MGNSENPQLILGVAADRTSNSRNILSAWRVITAQIM